MLDRKLDETPYKCLTRLLFWQTTKVLMHWRLSPLCNDTFPMRTICLIMQWLTFLAGGFFFSALPFVSDVQSAAKVITAAITCTLYCFGFAYLQRFCQQDQ